MESSQGRLLLKDWRQYPRFRHNLWTEYPEEPGIVYLTVSHSKYSVSKDDADVFLRMRSYCNGHRTVPEIAVMSGVEMEKVQAMVDSLSDANVTRPQSVDLASMPNELILEVLLSACRIWREQVAETYIAAELVAGKLGREILIGWLLEEYHYVKAFPGALDCAAVSATGRLRDLLMTYASQEKGHEQYIAECLMQLGLKESEIVQSIPLVSTRAIDFLMREMYEESPCAALLVAAVVEASDTSVAMSEPLGARIAAQYRLPSSALAAYDKHVAIDAQLGHASLALDHGDLISFSDPDRIHRVCNRLHDIKHAFDLQSLEIKHYYSHLGNYLPRQPVDFFSI